MTPFVAPKGRDIPVHHGDRVHPAATVHQGAFTMTESSLPDLYRAYIACLNAQDWPRLPHLVADDVIHNGRQVGIAGYQAMLERDFREIPDLAFTIQLLIADPPYVASRLAFDCRPRGTFFDLPINGKRVTFTENVFYRFRDGKIIQVWSVIDTAAIAAQL